VVQRRWDQPLWWSSVEGVEGKDEICTPWSKATRVLSDQTPRAHFPNQFSSIRYPSGKPQLTHIALPVLAQLSHI
jgi:hypothetical protein